LNSTTCKTTTPGAANTAAIWNVFDRTTATNNTTNWSQYDINTYNIDDSVRIGYKGFNEGVICKAASATSVLNEIICVDGSVPSRTKICNKATCTANDATLPYTRDDGYLASPQYTVASYKTANIGKNYFDYVANT
jgi:hypothetical protein